MDIEEFAKIYKKSIYYKGNKSKRMKLIFISDFMQSDKETAEKILLILETKQQEVKI